MASQAEVDLIISTVGTLPQLERELETIIQTAEAGADDVELEATLDRRESVNNLISGLRDAIETTTSFTPGIEVDAALNTLDTLTDISQALDDVIEVVEARAEPIGLEADLDADVAELDAEIAALVNDLERSAPEIDLEVDVDRDGRGLRALTQLGGAATSALGPLTQLGTAGLALGSAVPLVAGLAAAVAQIAPASALAVSGLLTVQLATNTVKIAMLGVKEAVATAFDPDAKPEDLAKAMEKLAPNARAFVTELRSMKSAFGEIQQDVQNRFFSGLDTTLSNLGSSVLPVVGSALSRTADELNIMAKGAGQAAVQLAKDGTLGKALDSSVLGLNNLSKAPGQVVTGLGQIAAAAGPAFERVTAAAGKAGDKLADKLTAGFKSGALEEAIDRAVDAIVQLGRIAGNVFGGLGNIFRTVSTEGGGLFSTLEKVTQAFEDVTATKGFQEALKALISTAGVLVDTILPIISTALQALGPVLQALAPPVQLLVKALGDALGPVIKALSPVLVAVGLAFGRLVGALTPLIALAGTLIAAVLPILTPLFDALGKVLNALIPFIKQVADTLIAELVPIFTALATQVLPVLLPPLIELATAIFPVLTKIIAQVAPLVAKMAETFALLLVAVAPVIAQLAVLVVTLLEQLLPIIQPIIDLLINFAEGGLKFVAAVITNITIPLLGVLVDLLKGDFHAAWEGAKEIVRNVVTKIGELFGILVAAAKQKFTEMALAVSDKINQIKDNVVQRLTEMVLSAVERIRSFPDQAVAALGNLGNRLFSAGQDLIQGLIDGMRSMLSTVQSIAQEIADATVGSVKNVLGIHSPSTVMAEAGRDTMDGFILGLSQRVPDLRSQLQSVAALAPSFALPNGQTLQLPNLTQSAPTVQVFIGNEQLTGHVDARIAQSNRGRDILVKQGVRR